MNENVPKRNDPLIIADARGSLWIVLRQPADCLAYDLEVSFYSLS